MNFPSPISPQAKLIQTSDKFGNKAVQYQQGTTREIYDSLPLDGKTEFRFFENVSSRAFPFTNINENKLSALETLTVIDVYFDIIEINPQTGEILSIDTFDDIDINIQAGQWELVHAESTIAKELPLLSQRSENNPQAQFLGHTNYKMKTLLTLQPDLQFTFKLRIPFGITITDSHLRMNIAGIGTLISPKTTM